MKMIVLLCGIDDADDNDDDDDLFTQVWTCGCLR